jgi:hypothetical protein
VIGVAALDVTSRSAATKRMLDFGAHPFRMPLSLSFDVGRSLSSQASETWPRTLNGDAGTDRLLGGAGADTLAGGAEADVCNGGSEVDQFAGCETQSN